jgi:hypothetical protein
VIIRVPCDAAQLATSPDLPPSPFTSSDSLFGTRELAQVAAALDLGLQPSFSPARPHLVFSLAEGALRFNRVEGVSVGAGVEQRLGGGWTARQFVRYGAADGRMLTTTTLTRSTGRRQVQLRAYRELAVATDGGDPLSVGASLNALWQGLDDGMYYRVNGADLRWGTATATGLSWRVFTERQENAPLATRRTITGGGNDARVPENVTADDGWWTGASLGARHDVGDDPAGWRGLVRASLEGGAGPTGYLRGLAEISLSRPVIRQFGVTWTGALGTTVGDVPSQRRFFLGGLTTVRGQRVSPTTPGLAGTALWYSRHEIWRGNAAWRLGAFLDIGWAGDRALAFGPSRAPVQGAGLGLSLLDGLMRVEVAEGWRPLRQRRVDVSFGFAF